MTILLLVVLLVAGDTPGRSFTRRSAVHALARVVARYLRLQPMLVVVRVAARVDIPCAADETR